jgi:hypothetical protein
MEAADSLYGVLEDPATLPDAPRIDPVEAILVADEKAEEGAAAKPNKPCTAPTGGWVCSGAEGHEGPCAASPGWRVNNPLLLDPATGIPADSARAALLDAYDQSVAQVQALPDDEHRNATLALMATVKAQADASEGVFQALHGDRLRRIAEPTTDAGDAAEQVAVHGLDLRDLAGGTVAISPLHVTMHEPPQRESAVTRTIKKWLGRR